MLALSRRFGSFGFLQESTLFDPRELCPLQLSSLLDSRELCARGSSPQRSEPYQHHAEISDRPALAPPAAVQHAREAGLNDAAQHRREAEPLQIRQYLGARPAGSTFTISALSFPCNFAPTMTEIVGKLTLD